MPLNRIKIEQQSDVRGKKNAFFDDVGFGEYYIQKYGISHSARNIHQHFAKRYADQMTGVDFEPRLGQDADNVLQIMDSGCGPALIQGDLGVGKSTVLFSVRRKMRERGEEYICIDGHFTSEYEFIANAIKRSRQDRTTLIYDSFDYMFITDARRNGTTRARQGILHEIGETNAAGSKVLLTAHTAPWFDANSSPRLTNIYNDTIQKLDVTPYRVYGQIDNAGERRELAADFFEDNGGGLTEAYMEFSTNSELATARQHRVMKQMAVMVVIKHIAFPTNQTEFDNMVRSIDDQTRQKMRAPADYSFSPRDETGIAGI